MAGFVSPNGLSLGSTSSRPCISVCKRKTCVVSVSCKRIIPVMQAEATAPEETAPTVSAERLSANTAALKTVLNIEQIMKILPHRYPFLLVDKIVHFEPGKVAIGVKNVSMNEPQFTGHFPDRPIMPGVLMIEAMAQVGGIVMLQEPITDGKGQFFFAGIDAVKWRKPVLPGDTLVMEMELKVFKKKFGVGKMIGRAYVDGKLAVEGEFTFAYAP